MTKIFSKFGKRVFIFMTMKLLTVWLHQLHVLQVVTSKIENTCRKLDIKFRKIVRAIVGPRGGLGWPAPWHGKERNGCVLDFTEQSGVELLSRRCFEQCLKVDYIANLPDHRWLKHTLAWTTGRRIKIGKSSNTQTHGILKYKCNAHGND